jgi:hypothetical protein
MARARVWEQLDAPAGRELVVTAARWERACQPTARRFFYLERIYYAAKLAT